MCGKYAGRLGRYSMKEVIFVYNMPLGSALGAFRVSKAPKDAFEVHVLCPPRFKMEVGRICVPAVV